MRIKDSFDDGVQVLRLHGDFDAADASEFDAHIDRAIEQQHVRVVFDCRDLGDLTSSGLVALVRARKRLQEHGGGLTFARMRPDACAAFHAVGLDRIIRDVGVTKTTFYNHFESKDDLIIAAIRMRDRWETSSFERTVEHFTDGDLLNADHETGRHDPSAALRSQWGAPSVA